jgi:small subunit ribosomal protein S21
MARVNISEKKNFEKALRSFKKRCLREGIIRECRDRLHYVKPSKKRREKDRRRKRQK